MLGITGSPAVPPLASAPLPTIATMQERFATGGTLACPLGAPAPGAAWLARQCVKRAGHAGPGVIPKGGLATLAACDAKTVTRTPHTEVRSHTVAHGLVYMGRIMQLCARPPMRACACPHTLVWGSHACARAAAWVTAQR